MNLKKLSIPELLRTHSAIVDELKHRGVVRSSNNPVGDYTEWLVASKLGLKLQINSTAGYDAIDAKGFRYQIKGRRVASEKKPAQLGAIRNIDKNEFDYLIAVIFDPNYEVLYAAQIPHNMIARYSVYRKHVNAHILHLRKSILQDESIVELTEALRGDTLHQAEKAAYKLKEADILTTCALRFDGWKYKEQTGFDQVKAFDDYFQTGEWNISPLEQLASFFLLQRGLNKWDLVYEPMNGKYWKAYRTLFLMVYRYEIPREYANEEYCEKWEREYLPRLSECVSLVKEAHENTIYGEGI